MASKKGMSAHDFDTKEIDALFEKLDQETIKSMRGTGSELEEGFNMDKDYDKELEEAIKRGKELDKELANNREGERIVYSEPSSYFPASVMKEFGKKEESKIAPKKTVKKSTVQKKTTKKK